MTGPDITITPHPRSGAAAALTAANGTYEREFVVESDTNKAKWCPGGVAWNDLPYLFSDGGGGSGTNALVGIGGFVSPSLDLPGGGFTTIDLLNFDGSTRFPDIPRSAAVDGQVLVTSGDNLGLWTITASGPCTQGTVVGGDVFSDPGTGSGALYTATSAAGPGGTINGFASDITTPPTRYAPVATLGVHVGGIGQDGVDSFMVPDPDQQVISGGEYDGQPVWRLVDGDDQTLEGTPIGDLIGVMRATDQPAVSTDDYPSPDWDLWIAEGANNGTFEVFKNSNGVTGRYLVRTVDWNTNAFTDATLLATTLFGDGPSRTLWMTSGDGMASDSQPIQTKPANVIGLTDALTAFGADTDAATDLAGVQAAIATLVAALT